jgi:hypothetical protein
MPAPAHVVDEDSKAQRVLATCPQSHMGSGGAGIRSQVCLSLLLWLVSKSGLGTFLLQNPFVEKEMSRPHPRSVESDPLWRPGSGSQGRGRRRAAKTWEKLIHARS